jgi:MFS family permease
MVGVLFLLNVLSMLDRLIVTMLVGPIKAELLIGDFQMSLVLGPAFALFYALFGMPIGWAVDRFARRWIIFFGVSVWALATTASGFARSYEALLFFRICVGVGEAALAPAAVSLIADAFPKERVTTALSVSSPRRKLAPRWRRRSAVLRWCWRRLCSRSTACCSAASRSLGIW